LNSRGKLHERRDSDHADRRRNAGGPVSRLRARKTTTPPARSLQRLRQARKPGRRGPGDSRRDWPAQTLCPGLKRPDRDASPWMNALHGDPASEPASTGVSWSDGVVRIRDDRLFGPNGEALCDRLMERLLSVSGVRSVILDQARSTLTIRHVVSP